VSTVEQGIDTSVEAICEQNLEDAIQEKHFHTVFELNQGSEKCAFFNGKLAMSRKRREIGQGYYLKMAYFLSDEMKIFWMTLKVGMHYGC